MEGLGHPFLLGGGALLFSLVTSQGQDRKDIQVLLAQILVLIVVAGILQRTLKEPLFSPLFLSDWLIGAAWLFPVALYFKENRFLPNENSGFPYIPILSRKEVLFASYFVLFLISLKWSMLQHIRSPLLLACLFTLCSIAAVSVPLLCLAHFVRYRCGVHYRVVLAIQNTYWQEAKEYLLAYPKRWLFLLLFLLGAGGFLLGYLNCIEASGTHIYASESLPNGLLTVLLAWICWNGWRHTNLARVWKDARQYRAHERDYARCRSERLRRVCVRAAKGEGTHIVVIGESASRDYMHAYEPSIRYANTPWMESVEQDAHVVRFRNGYAACNQTGDVLKMVLTEMSQYADVDFLRAVSILELAKAAGYTVYWLSNRKSLGEENAAVTMLAKEADCFVAPDDAHGIQFDQELLRHLQYVDPDGKNLVFIHLMGSHANYASRYPSSAKAWEDASLEGAYANTIRYTDEVLRRIFAYASEDLNLQTMLYFSDHGEDLPLGHHPSIRSFHTVRIPVLVYWTDAYRRKNPMRATWLKRHEAAYFSNDMLYHTMIGLLGIETNCYRAAEDLSAEEYGYDRASVLTFWGETHIAEDAT